VAIVVDEPSGQVCGSVFLRAVGKPVDPFPEHDLHEPFCLAVGLWWVGFGMEGTAAVFDLRQDPIAPAMPN
jgi:hypothetical protein